MLMNKERKLGFGEGYSKFCHDYAAGTTILSGVVQVRGALKAQTVREALSIVQLRHPMLRAGFMDKEDDFDYFTFDEEPKTLPLTVMDRSGRDDWIDFHQKEYLTPFTDADDYLWRTTFLQNKEDESGEHELVASFHHSTSDGISLASFFKDFLYCCRCLADGENPDVKSLPITPSGEELLNLGTSWPAWIARNAVAAAFYLLEENKLYGYEAHAPLQLRRTRHVYHELDREYLPLLIALCKANGVTITALFSGVLMKACNEILGTEKGKSRQIAFTPFSLRKRFDPPLGNEHLGLYVGFVNTKYRVGPKNTVWDLAARFGEQLEKGIQRDIRMPGEFRKSLGRRFLTSFDKGLLKDVFQYGVGVTNIGAIDISARQGPFEITRIHFGTCRNWGDWLMLVHTSSLDGKLFFCSCYTEPLLGRDAAEKIMSRFVALLKGTVNESKLSAPTRDRADSRAWDNRGPAE